MMKYYEIRNKVALPNVPYGIHSNDRKNIIYHKSKELYNHLSKILIKEKAYIDLCNQTGDIPAFDKRLLLQLENIVNIFSSIMDEITVHKCSTEYAEGYYDSAIYKLKSFCYHEKLNDNKTLFLCLLS